MTNSKKSEKLIRELRGQLLNWYDRHKRVLPWRAINDARPDPYHVWLSEIMLQQTTVQAVKDYYIKFLSFWPTIHDLAAAEEADVMAAWAGLGYYARARNLHKCAKIVAERGGVFPDNEIELKKLPGIGDYTSAAISAIAFNSPATVMDGNIERVVARLFNIREPLPKSKPLFKAQTAKFFDGFYERPGDLAQAFMDLGASICIPKSPRCSLCPLSENCQAYNLDDPRTLPVKSPKKKRPQKYGYVYFVKDNTGQLLFEKRKPEGLLGGMVGLPTSEWIGDDGPSHLDVMTDILPYKGLYIDHVFTHFDLRLHLCEAHISGNKVDRFIYGSKGEMQKALPTVFAKAMKLYE
ncbi:MAG: A/G-specific adenine glycosylase [Micavibrio sp.]|nr:A/G-specific adenine glycosylase [Micavibrio sp.]